MINPFRVVRSFSVFPLRVFPLKVHSWGGYGSQLFACVVARRLAKLFPHRRMVLIFHSSGVTQRYIEVPEVLLKDFKVIFRNDFREFSDSNHDTIRRNNYISLRSLLLGFLKRFGFLSQLNLQSDFESLRTCLWEVRGHYTQINLQLEEIDWILSSLIPPTEQKTISRQLAIHFRLGDLLKLSSKSHISVDRLAGVLLPLKESNSIVLFSDSSKEDVRTLMKDTLDSDKVQILNLPTEEVIAHCINADIFIGTNSKISLWIAMFRIMQKHETTTYLPNEMAAMLATLLNRLISPITIMTY